jgi:aminotransferase
MLNLPCNPTGGTCDRARLEKIARFAVEKDLIVLSDEIYSELVYDNSHTSIAVFPGMKERTIFLHGFSKAFAMTGFRIGYACGPAELIDAMMKVHQYSMLCAPILSQEAAIEALARGEDGMKSMREKYHTRRDLVVGRLNAAGLACGSPGGAFYVFPSVASTGLSERDFAYGLLDSQKVAVVPGTAFGENGKGYVRASFATGFEHLVEACDRIERFVNTAKPCSVPSSS